jgi:hypothetical protein
VATTYYKVLIFLKRRSGMSLADFRDYYENTHVKLCSKYSKNLSRYVRRYVTPLPNAVTGNADELDFDVVTELWYEDRALYEKVLDYAARGVLPADVIADEERVFDRTRIRYASIVECETVVTAV